jgi:hypothetical protein
LHTTAQLPGGTTDVRWRLSTDPLYAGRGMYVDGVRVLSANGVLFDGERPSDAGRFQAHGWTIAKT